MLAAIFALVVLRSRRNRPTEIRYWVAIVIVRAAATNLSDLQTLQFGIPFFGVMGFLSVLLATLVVLDRRDLTGQTAPVGGGVFWITMLVAGTLGTAVGDDLAFVQGFRPAQAAAIMTMVLAGTFVLRAMARGGSAAAYWMTVIVVRTWGTNVGDFSADTIGLVESTAASGLLLVGLLLVWQAPLREPLSRRAADASG